VFFAFNYLFADCNVHWSFCLFVFIGRLHLTTENNGGCHIMKKHFQIVIPLAPSKLVFLSFSSIYKGLLSIMLYNVINIYNHDDSIHKIQHYEYIICYPSAHILVVIAVIPTSSLTNCRCVFVTDQSNR